MRRENYFRVALVALLLFALSGCVAHGCEWHILTVDSAGNVGEYASLEVVNDNPAISYYDMTDGDLKYVRAADASGSSWETPVTVDSAGDVGRYTSLEVVNGNPAISYYDMTNGNLKYVRAADASGSSWETPVTVDHGGGVVGGHTSLAVVSGNPAISYCDEAKGDLKYVRADDSRGSSWGTPVLLDSARYVGWYASLAVVNGKPAISYHDPSMDTNLKYVRATDASGSSWGTPVTVESDGYVGWFTSLAVVNGNPAIAYSEHYMDSNDDLKYVRADDASGSSWGKPVTVDSAGCVGYHTSLAVVKGNPAISYLDSSKGNLKYVRADDANGSSWETPVTVDSAGCVGYYTSLAVVNGKPAIAYRNVTNRSLKYAILY